MKVYVLLFVFEDGDSWFHRSFVDVFSSADLARARACAENNVIVHKASKCFPIFGPTDKVPWKDAYEDNFAQGYGPCWQIVQRELEN